ncbi:MAG TPA: DUF58 domain-containing protein [Steroidobacteraceae bacterium]|nr:DUF58 domain-containing protein [Steroidobacteraceae bacterium]
MRRAVANRLRAWAMRRHGRDSLPISIHRRRIYLMPTRFGVMLGAILAAMLMAGLNYNSNLALGFAFLMSSVAFVIMHHCNRNLQRLSVDVTTEVDAFAGREAIFEFALRNGSNVDRCDIEARCLTGSGMGSVPARESGTIEVIAPVVRRGVTRVRQFELRTRYPFGWFFSWTYVQGLITIYVAPAPAGTKTLPSAGAKGTGTHSETRGEEDFSGLRAYEPGVPLKHMAWKVLARGGEAAVRSYSSLAAQPEWLEWSSLDGMALEARLSQLCLWVLESDAAQRPYGLRIPGREIAPSGGAAHRFACLRALASFGSDHTAEPER